MKLTRKANTIGALMIAAGAIVSGASITSGAMAADDAGGDATANVVVIGSASADGDAYQCEFDDVELPTFDVSTLPAGVDTQSGVVVSAAESAGGDQIVLSPVDGPIAPPEGDGPISITIDDNGVVIGERADGTPIDLGGAQVGITVGGAGTVSIDDSGQVIVSSAGALPADALPVPADATVVEVRDGTPDECAALLEQKAALPAIPAAPDATEATTAP